MIELCSGERAPNSVDVARYSEILGAAEIMQIINEHRHGLLLVIELLVDDKCLFVQAILNTDSGNVRPIELVQTINVLHDAALVLLRKLSSTRDLHRRQNQEILQILVRGKLRISPQDDFLEQLDEFVRQVCRHESFHSAGHGLAILALRKSGRNHLINERTLVRILFRQNLGPEIQVLTINKELRLGLEQSVLISDGDSLVIAHSFRTAVYNKCQVRVTLGAVGTNSLVVVITIRLKEFLRALVGVDVDHGERVVNCRILLSFIEPSLEPRKEKPQPIAFLARRDKAFGWAHIPNGHDQRPNLVFRTACIDESTDYLRGSERVDLLYVHFNVLHHPLAVQELSKLLNHVMLIAHIDQWAGIWELGLALEEVLHLLSRIIRRFPSDAFQFLVVIPHHTNLRASDNVFVVHVFVIAEVHNRAEIVEETLHRFVLLKQGHQSLRSHNLRILRCNLNTDLEVLPQILGQHLSQQLQSPGCLEVSKPLQDEIRLNLRRMHDNSLEIIQFCVMLKRTLKEPCHLA
mmetsp:Transcript_5533/g.12291  ORF Transcript_5533/g.12291 Transcript_5533/m.12291 type:complete len:520 (-) Transcript_5533:856-2415(-)